MKPDEKWRRLCATEHAAMDELYAALTPVVEKQAAIAAGSTSVNSSFAEDERLRAARRAGDSIHIEMKQFIADNTGGK
jgi:hypothetical protein